MADETKTVNPAVLRSLALWRNLNLWLSRADFIGRLGKQFGDKRDTYEVLGYPRNPVFADYYAEFTRGDIASRIINAPVEATWQGKISVEDEFLSSDDSNFETDFKKLDKWLKIFHYLERADRLAGIGRYSILLIGVAEQANLQLPLGRVRGPGDILYLAPFSEDSAQIHSFVENPSDPDYGRPLLYDLRVGSPATTGTLTKNRSVKVHKSRVIHVAEGLLEDEVFGRPRLEKVFNRLYDLAKVVGGSAETFWLIANRGIHAKIDPEMELAPEDAASMEEQISDYQHQLRRFLQTRGVEIKSLGAESVNPEGVFKVLISVISGATGIPQRILLGSEMGQLASSQDRANWAARISSRQKSFAESCMLRPLLDRFIEIGALPEPIDRRYEVSWPDALVLNETEKAQRANQVASASNNLNREVVTIAEFRERFLGLPAELPEPAPRGDKTVN